MKLAWPRQTLAGIGLYTQGHVNHVKVSLFSLDAGNAETAIASKDVLPGAFSKPITFGNLRPDTRYRVKSHAYKAAGEAPKDLISVNDERSWAIIDIQRNDDVTATALPVRLVDAARPYVSTLDFAFKKVVNVTSDAEDNVYVLDVDVVAHSARIVKVTPQGVASTLPGTLSDEVGGLAIDPSGNMYVASAGTIQKVTSAGHVSTLWSDASIRPLSLSIHAAGDIYFGTEDALYHLPAGSATARQVATGFDLATGVTLDGAGNVFVADRRKGRVLKFPLSSFVGPVVDADLFVFKRSLIAPCAVQIDAAGQVFVLESGFYVLKRFSSDGTTVTTWVGRAGQMNLIDGFADAEARLQLGLDLALTPSGTLYVAETGMGNMLRKVD